MPVTKTAKRALRGSNRKTLVNKRIVRDLEVAIRAAKKSKKTEDIRKAASLTDRASKKMVLHKNKASRLKSSLSKLAKQEKNTKEKPSTNKSKGKSKK